MTKTCAPVAHRLIESPAVEHVARGDRTMQHDDERPRPPDEPERAPDTPSDEPKPTPVQDPPAEPGKAPYVVRDRTTGSLHESRAMDDAAKVRMMGERKERRGFASMSPEKQREIASKGGRAAHQKGTAHEWTSEEAREAGRKGGMASHRRRKEMMDQQGGLGSTETSMGQTETTERSGGDDQNEQIR